jgi:RimJ/RimL family protein N-acetyltransferase
MQPACQTTHIRLPVTPELSLTEFLRTDEAAVIEHLADREISDRTTGIAFPYGPEEFYRTMRTVAERAWEHCGCPAHFAIRDANDFFIGCVTFSDLIEGHSASLAYWLAKPFWNKKIMTAAVGVACQFAIERWNLVRISAPVFDGNVASARVLEKCGFEFEGLMRGYFFKDGRFIDARLYAWVAEFLTPPF